MAKQAQSAGIVSSVSPRTEAPDDPAPNPAAAGLSSVDRVRLDAYGVGCQEGVMRARIWLSSPRRGVPDVGGTLQYVVLDLARRLAEAPDKQARERATGEIVGFCYRVECPESAESCFTAAESRFVVAAARASQRGGAA